MPLLLRCDELEPGMWLFEPIVWQGRTLLTGENPLTYADIDALCRKYPELLVRVGDPILDDVVGFENDSKDRLVAATAQGKIGQAMTRVGERFSSHTSITSADMHALHSSVAEVMKYLKNNPVSAALLSRTLAPGSYLAEHAGSVFYLSMILGCAVRDYVDAERRRRTTYRWQDLKISMDLLPLGLGAMLADLGMFPLQHLFRKAEPLTEEDWQALAEHPEAGADMLPEDFSPTARAIVKTHHEKFDGTGYPGRLKGPDIHVFSRLVRIADAYDSATSSHIYKKAKSPARTLWEMSAGPFKSCYDPLLMKIFCGLIQPFPIGARLRLDDGRCAVVVRYNRHDSFRPTVMIAFDVNGERLPDSSLEGPVHLAQRQDLRLAAFGDEDLSYLQKAPSDKELLPNPNDAGMILDAVYP